MAAWPETQYFILLRFFLYNLVVNIFGNKENSLLGSDSEVNSGEEEANVDALFITECGSLKFDFVTSS